jgi:hypothetical protein
MQSPGKTGDSVRGSIPIASPVPSAAYRCSPVLLPDTSFAAVRQRLGTEPMTAEEFEQHFGNLLTDDEGRLAQGTANATLGGAARAG